MHDKTIMRARLQEQAPLLLQRSGTPLQTVERSTSLLKERHGSWTEVRTRQRPASDPHQMASQALALAVQEMRDTVPAASTTNAAKAQETRCLGAAMASLRRHTPPAPARPRPRRPPCRLRIRRPRVRWRRGLGSHPW
jgi:hypothetical protein